jgi:hypothetical protein
MQQLSTFTTWDETQVISVMFTVPKQKKTQAATFRQWAQSWNKEPINLSRAQISGRDFRYDVWYFEAPEGMTLEHVRGAARDLILKEDYMVRDAAGDVICFTDSKEEDDE